MLNVKHDFNIFKYLLITKFVIITKFNVTFISCLWDDADDIDIFKN